MWPILFNLPVWLAALPCGALVGVFFLMPQKASVAARWAVGLLGAGGGMLLAGFVAQRVFGVEGIGAGLTQSIPIRGYGTMILLGFLVAVYLAARRAPQIGVESYHALDVGLLGLLTGVVGSRLFFVVEEWNEFSPFGPRGWSALLGVFKIWEGGLVFFGGLFAAWIAGSIYLRRHKIPIIPFLDLMAPSFMTGLAFGRIGCFLNGCCYGKVCELPWAVRFPPGSPPYGDEFGLQLHTIRAFGGRGEMEYYQLHPFTQPIHPTQLYAMLGAGLSAAFLYALWPRRFYDGFIFGLMLILAGVTRFFEELLRADNPPAFPQVSEVFTIAQWISIAMILAGTAWLLYFRSRKTPALQTSTPV